MLAYLMVFVGAGLGGVLRHLINMLVFQQGLDLTPLGTMGINILGSFMMGVLVEFFALRSGLSQHWRLFLTTGVLGGFTTFSTFSLEASRFLQTSQWLYAFGYITGSLLLGIGGLFLGLASVRLALAV